MLRLILVFELCPDKASSSIMGIGYETNLILAF